VLKVSLCQQHIDIESSTIKQ